MLAQDQNSGIRNLAENQLGGLKTVDVGHADIHQDDVRQQLFRFFDGIKTVNRLATYFQLGARFQYRAETPTKNLVVVGQQNAWSFVFHSVHTLRRK